MGKRANTFNIAVEVYQTIPDEDGNRTINDAEHVAVKRALNGLRHKGLIFGQRELHRFPDGSIRLGITKHPRGLYAERCCLWSTNADTWRKLSPFPQRSSDNGKLESYMDSRAERCCPGSTSEAA
jgi:hypothetical protein